MIVKAGPELFRDAFLRSEAAAQLYVDERVDGAGRFLYLDKVGSVSGSPPPELHWDDALIEEQDRRFHHGS